MKKRLSAVVRSKIVFSAVLTTFVFTTVSYGAAVEIVGFERSVCVDYDIVEHPSSPEYYFVLYRSHHLESEFEPVDIALDATRETGFLAASKSDLGEQATFYVVKQVPLNEPRDADGDGIDDVEELSKSPPTDPLDPDNSIQRRKVVGQIVSPEGEPLSGVSISFPCFPPARAMTDSNGYFTINRVPHRVVRLEASLTFASAVHYMRKTVSIDFSSEPEIDLGTISLEAPEPAPARIAMHHSGTGRGTASAAIKKDGTLWLWDHFPSVPRPMYPQDYFADDDWTKVTIGAGGVAAIKENGTLWAISTAGWPPSQVESARDWRDVAQGYGVTVGVKEDGTVWYLTRLDLYLPRGSDELDDPNPVFHHLQLPEKVVDIAVVDPDSSTAGFVALSQAGNLWKLRKNARATGNDDLFYEPSQIDSDRKWRALSGQSETTYAIDWEGVSKIVTFDKLPNLIATDLGADWNQIAAGEGQSIAIKTDGTLWIWGNHNGDDSASQKTSPIQIGHDSVWIAVAAAYDRSMAISSDGLLFEWGPVSGKQLKREMLEVESELPWRKIAAGHSHSAAIRNDGTLWTWGLNEGGELGDGSTTSRFLPRQIGTESDWEKISCGYNHTLAVRSDGSLWAWGRNEGLQLGVSDVGRSAHPLRINGDTWLEASAGRAHSLGIKADGSMWAWGYNNDGQLGIGSSQETSPLRQIGEDRRWTAIAAGHDHSLAVAEDGSLWSWGYNEYAKLAQPWVENTPGHLPIPTRVETGNLWKSVSAGRHHSVALSSDGSLWAWGRRTGIPSAEGYVHTPIYGYPTPTRVVEENEWKSVSTGGAFSLALRNDGELYIWGDADAIQGEEPLTESAFSPHFYHLKGGPWKDIVAGHEYWMGVDTNGVLWSLGENSHGQLGTGSKRQILDEM